MMIKRLIGISIIVIGWITMVIGSALVISD